MRPTSRAPVFALIVCVSCLLGAAPALGGTLGAVTQTATAIGQHGATLTGQVSPSGAGTTYYFEYGTTTAYGSSTPSTLVANPPSTQGVQAIVSGLAAGTVYHYRLVAEGSGTAYGQDATFTTLADGTSNDGDPSTAPGTSGTTPIDPLHGADPITGGPLGTTPTDQPALGRSVAVGPSAGSIRVKLPGQSRFASLPSNAAIPVGSTIDARQGTVALVTALGESGATQAASFKGAVFQVRQAAGGHGMTDIYLRETPHSCRSARAASAVRHRRKLASLWAHDNHGRFRSHGAHGVATVRGTTWLMTDSCDGTLTKVVAGSVSVRDLHTHTTHVLHAGQSYLARAR